MMNQRQRSIQLSTKLIYLRDAEARGETTVPIADMIRLCETWLDDTGFGPNHNRPTEIEGQLELA